MEKGTRPGRVKHSATLTHYDLDDLQWRLWRQRFNKGNKDSVVAFMSAVL